MWSLIKKVWRDTHTTMDNATYDWAKVTGSGSIMVYLALCSFHLRDDNVFDPVQFATGLCAIIGTVCAGVAVKNATKSEPVLGTVTKTTLNQTEVKVE